MIYVLASIKLKDASFREEFLKIFKANVPNVLAEDGCIMYVPTIDFDSKLDAQRDGVRGDVVTIVEAWASLDHLMAHLKAPHMNEYRVKVKAFVDKSSLTVTEPA